MTSPSFIAANAPTTTPASDVTIGNHAFYPDLSLNDFRKAMRVDNVTTPERAVTVLETAIIEVNDRLSVWMLEKMGAGINAIADVELKPGRPDGSNNKLYLRAVWSLAKAMLIEHYRDYDTTTTASSQAQELDITAADCRRDAAWAINDLIGSTRSTIELI